MSPHVNPNVWSACPDCGEGTSLDDAAVVENEPAVYCPECDARTYGDLDPEHPRAEEIREAREEARGATSDDDETEWIENDDGDTVPKRSEPADFGGGESTGVQTL